MKQGLLIFLVFFVLVSLLRCDAFSLLPFWDELGHYIPYAYTLFENDFKLHNKWTHVYATHPPFYFMIIAAFAKIFGWKMEVIRTVTFATTALALTGSFYVMRIWVRPAIAWTACFALACTPVVLSESALAQADLPMMTCLVWAIYFVARQKIVAGSFLFAFTILANATAIPLAPAFALWIALQGRKPFQEGLAAEIKRQVLFFLPTLVLFSAWVAYHYSVENAFFSPVKETDHMNFVYRRGPLFVINRIAHRFYQIFIEDFRWVLSALFAARAWSVFRKTKSFLSLYATEYALLGLIFSMMIFLSFFGATQQRYFLAIVPAVFILGAIAAEYLVAQAKSPGAARVAVAIFAIYCVAGLWAWRSPPTKYATFEYRSAYADQVRLVKKAIHEISSKHSGSKVFAVWPVSSALKFPYLGYSSHAIDAQEVRGASSLEGALSGQTVLALLYEKEAGRPGWTSQFNLGCEALNEGIWQIDICRMQGHN